MKEWEVTITVTVKAETAHLAAWEAREKLRAPKGPQVFCRVREVGAPPPVDHNYEVVL